MYSPPPVFEENTGAFIIKFYKSISTHSLKSKEKSEEKIVALLKNNSNITINDIASKLDLSASYIEKQLAKQKKQKLIQRIGGRKKGEWRVLYASPQDDKTPNAQQTTNNKHGTQNTEQ